jgi:hypothetical protein
MRSLVFLIALVYTTSMQTGAAEIDWDASVSLNLAAHTEGAEPDFTEKGSQFNLKFTQDHSDYTFTGEGRVRWNNAYANSAYGEDARDAYEFSADWRELYLAKDIGGWNISVGLQQVVWGKADNLRVVDLINPLDYRDFVLPDLSDYRKPVLMLKGEYDLNNWSLQTLYIPFFEPNDFARHGSEYEYSTLDPERNTFLPAVHPSRSFKNGEFGLQLARSFSGLDFNFFALHSWDDNPVYRQLYVLNDDQNFLVGLQPEYHRQMMLGASSAYSLGNGLVLRSEISIVPNNVYMLTALDVSGGLVEESTFNALIGIDYSWRDWLFSAQANDRYIDNWNSELNVTEHQPLVTFSATGQSFSGRLDTRIAFARFIEGKNEQLMQLKTTWKPNDSWAYSLGADWFSGIAGGVFGQFENKDRIWLKVLRNF